MTPPRKDKAPTPAEAKGPGATTTPTVDPIESEGEGHALLIRFSTLPKAVTTVSPKRHEMTWSEFAAKFARPAVRERKDGTAWLPALYRPDTTRAKANVETITAWGIDLDEGNLAAEEIAQALNGYTYLAHTTWSSTPDNRRWRVIVPLRRPVAPTKASSLFHHFQQLIGGKADEACKDPSRLYFTPACPPGAEQHFQFLQRDGEVFDASYLADVAVDERERVEITSAVPQRVLDLIATNKHLRRRWEGDTTGLKDSSRSELDAAVVSSLAKAGCFPDEIAAALLHYPHGKAADSPRRYLEGLVAKFGVKPEPGNNGELIHRCMIDIEPVPIRWLWKPRFALGKLSLVAGEPGVGKSHLMLGVVAAVSTGGTFPDGSPCDQGNAIILSAEDGAADTIRTRLEAAGADLRRVHILEAVIDGYSKDGHPLRRGVDIASDLQRLAALIEKLGDVRLITIDPISAYLGRGKIDANSNADVRAVLAPVGDLAEAHNIAVICVSHLSKDDKKKAMSRVSGSMAFVAAARSAYIVSRDPEDESRRLFLPLKNNLGPEHGGLAFVLESVTLPNGIETSRILWHEGEVSTSADDALGGAGEAESGALHDAKAFLTEALAGGWRPAHEVFSEAETAGLKEITVRRAKKALKITSAKDGGPNGTWWMWSLPGARPRERGEF